MSALGAVSVFGDLPPIKTPTLGKCAFLWHSAHATNRFVLARSARRFVGKEKSVSVRLIADFVLTAS
jgi:hypothetical protein